MAETIAKALFNRYYRDDQDMLATWDGLGEGARQLWLDMAQTAMDTKAAEDEVAAISFRQKQDRGTV